MVHVAAVIVAAGQGLRAGGGVPKQFREIGGIALLRRTLTTFTDNTDITDVQLVIRPADRQLVQSMTRDLSILPPVFGGKTRQTSVHAGLDALARRAPDIVLVHDAARPFASEALISRAIKAAAKTGAAIPVLPVTDTVKRVNSSNAVEATIDRTSLRLVQTPQAFTFPELLDAHRRAVAQGRDDFTDDAALAEWAGLTVSVFAGEPDNIKLTTPEDFARAESMQAGLLGDVRIGSGLDVHAFGPGDHVTLGGVRIPHTQALTGHSDADVALHALTDAILGALAEGDIGAHFPPSDPQWRGASSDRFLSFAVERVRARRGRIANLDLTIVCESPRIGVHRDAMRTNIAGIAGLSVERVGVKATTSEKLGFTGRGEGIAAYATATIRLPWE
ncbi:MAG TPA: bifunctional 2-C-methyl-D-erythritol 4-phosphate cytidylyltransferase/2-C-methyl-D-erythritol 2,4-cyclodiphosphate synthase [Pseudolabrys sp.]|nr:bifunctional 2-C-methyl-D-erythritol 4-phosphate cytidylyltransferase/2-C-methyl-D-erythritol 2,4-cyclodiphosphate synthase [Pseudolabrys sp.]